MTPPAPLPNVRRANRALASAWRAGLLPEPRLDAGALVAAASRGHPERDFGDDTRWREPLDRLLGSLRDEAALNPLGRAMAHGQIVMMLRARIRAVALWRAHPEILDRITADKKLTDETIEALKNAIIEFKRTVSV